MATAIPQSSPPRSDHPGEAVGRVAGDEVLLRAIEEARVALWRAELSRTLLKGLVAAVIGLIAWFVVDQWIWSPGIVGRLLAFGIVIAACGWWAWTQLLPLTRSRVRADYAAFSLEADLPELQHSLTSYISLRGDSDASGLRGAVLRSMATRAAGQIKRHRIEIPSEATGTFRWWILFAASLAAFAAYGLLSPKNTVSSAQRLLLPLANVAPPTRVTIRDVAPGDCQTLTQRPLEITARIDGLGAKDEPLVIFGSDFRRRAPLRFDDGTGLYRTTIAVTQSTQYRVVGGDADVGPFEIVARDVPVASIEAVEITPPRYTGSPPRTSTGGAILAEEHSRVTVAADLNRPMVRARLEFNPRPDAVSLNPSAAVPNDRVVAAPRGMAAAGGVDMQIAEDGLSATATFPLRLPRPQNGVVAIDSYRVRVWDADGNDNPEPIIYPIRITPDLAPEVQIRTPREPAREVPLNGQLLFEISAVDPDFGLRRVEWVMRRGVDPITTTILWSSETGVTENQLIEHRFVPAKLGFRAGDTVYVKVAASDNREDIEEQPEPNRSETQPIELKIVEPRQLPPPSAPENGLSEPEEEGAGDQAAGGGDQSGDKQSDQTGGQPGGSGESGSGDSPNSQAGKQAGGQGNSSGDAAQDPQPGTDGSGQSDASQSNSPPGTGGQPGGMDVPSDSNGQGTPAEGAAGPEGQPDAAAKPSDAPGAGGDSKSEGQSTDSSTAEGQSPGQPTAGQGQSEDPSNSGKPPQHDGDAFERIRDFLEEQRGQTGDGKSTADQQPPAGQNPPPMGEQDPAPAGEPSGQPRGDQSGSKPNRQPATENDPAGQSDPAGSEAAGQDSPTPQSPAGEPSPGRETTAPQGQPGSSPPAGAEGQGSQPKPQPGQDGAGDAQKPMADGAAGAPPSEPADGAADPSGDSEAGKQGHSPAENQGKGKGTDQPASENPSDPASSASNSGGEQAAGAESAQPAASGDKPSTASPSGNASGGDGGVPSDAGSGNGLTPAALPPDPVDVDYARQATDLVLDYLNQNRETPDPELLERLNWTPEELRDFTQRWMRNLKATEGSGATADPQQVEDSLKSLGIRKPNRGPIGASREAADDVRSLRDAGGRLEPPRIYKDAFEAFRRGVNRP